LPDSAIRRLTILIVAATRLYREGLAQVLERREALRVVGMAGDRRDALAKVHELRPEIVLLDMATPESHAAVRDIESLTPASRVVALGVADVEADVLACAEAGVAGYVRREGSLEDLVVAVEGVARGEMLCSPELAGSLWRRVAVLSANQQVASNVADLTRREREVVRLIDHDLSNKEIARQLGIGVATVKNHVHNLLDKLHVNTRAQAAACARVGSLAPPLRSMVP
jgi:DNA-binding NarL/FixJ family response regulator